MNILVTGGCGFIGSNFCKYWKETHPQDSITVLDYMTYAVLPANMNLLFSLGISVIPGSICDVELVDAIVKDKDLIVHFAAETHVDNSIKNPFIFTQTNVIGTQTLLESSRKYNVRFHHISTDEVFGSLELTDPKFTENTPYDPRSPYSASKASSDHLVRAYYHTYGLPITISNCSNNYGPHQHTEKLIPKTITNLLNGNKIPVYGAGLNVRDWIFCMDHCSAIDTIITKGTIGETYLVGGNCEMSNIDIIKKIISIMGMSEENIQFVEDRKGHDLRYAIDASKLNKLGWSASMFIDNGLIKTIEWYKNENI